MKISRFHILEKWPKLLCTLPLVNCVLNPTFLYYCKIIKKIISTSLELKKMTASMAKHNWHTSLFPRSASRQAVTDYACLSQYSIEWEIRCPPSMADLSIFLILCWNKILINNLVHQIKDGVVDVFLNLKIQVPLCNKKYLKKKIQNISGKWVNCLLFDKIVLPSRTVLFKDV